jgi:hypothetical protein
MASPVVQENVMVNVSPAFKCWRMVYDLAGKKVLSLFESGGTTKTAWPLFCSDPTDGTAAGSVTSAAGEAECMAEIKALGLTYTPPSGPPGSPPGSPPHG